MKCRQCGNSFHKGLICPLCGHKNIGQIHCAVCGKIIHYGQGHCSSCGSPTQYCKKGEVVINGDIIDYTVHSEASHTYEQQEQYDYKKNAYQYNQVNSDQKNKKEDLYKEQYDYKKDAYQYDQKENTKKKEYISAWIETVKEKQEQMQKTVRSNIPYSTKGTGAPGNIVAGIVIIVLIIGFCISAIFPDNDEGIATTMDYSNSSVENLPIIGTNNNLMEQANFSNGQWSSLYGEQLYVTHGPLYTVNKDFMEPATVYDTIRYCVYKNDTQMYYINDIDVLSCLNINTNEEEIISENVVEAVYLDGSLYYLIYEDRTIIYQYNMSKQQTTLLTKEYGTSLHVDTTTNKVYYLDIDAKLTAVSNLNESKRTYDKYDLPITNFLVEGNTLYTYDTGRGFSIYDLASQQEISNTMYYEVRQYARIASGYLCLLEDGDVCKVLDDGTFIPIITEDIQFIEMQLVGDKILLKDEDNGEIVLYIASENGELAQINF